MNFVRYQQKWEGRILRLEFYYYKKFIYFFRIVKNKMNFIFENLKEDFT